MTSTTERSHSQVIDELRDWLSDNWDPDLTVAEWWARLGPSGWAAPSLPVTAFGRGLSRSDSVQVSREIASFGALGAPNGLGLLLAAPTIAEHGTPEQIDTYVRDIVTGQAGWCQLFSEPGAGSDLAGLTARAVLDGDEYVVNGQKVWTSAGHVADLGMLLARTNPDVPKHQGITYFALDMHQSGVEIRPLKEMTGHALFNEVFMTDARVPTSAVIGDLHGGWRVANTTLANERAGLGSGGGGAAGGATPGTVAGNLPRRAGDFVRERPRQAASPQAARSNPAELLIGLAKGSGAASDPVVRQGLAQLYTVGELGRFNAERTKAARASGQDVPGMANISKLSMSIQMRLTRDLGLQIVGAQGMLHAYEGQDATVVTDATANPWLAGVTGMALFAQGPPIYGGTDQIQRNIIGERVLGLPKEPNKDRELPFSALPKNG